MTKILWVDDQLDVVRSAASALGGKEFHFEFCPDGESAISKISNNHYDIILIDLSMPPGKWGGLWLLGELNKQEEKRHVIIVSGEGTQAETIQALRLGANDYITKEELIEELAERLKTALVEISNNSKHLLKTIQSGESDTVEFKSTLRKNLRTNSNDSEIELAVFKTICGFMNKSGGSLFIGITDNGEIIGLNNDDFKNEDKFQLHFWNLFKESIGIEFVKYVNSSIIKIDEGSFFHIDCKKSDHPVFLKWKSKNNDFFYVRVGPQTEQLGTKQAISYIKTNFQS